MVVGIVSDSEGLVIFKRYQKSEDPSDSERVGCTSFPPVCLLRPMKPLSKRRLGQRFSILPPKSDVSALTQKLDQHHRTETDGVDHFRRRAREGVEMPDPSVWQEEFPFESRIALPEGVQPLPVRRAPERTSEPPRPADFHAPSPEPHFPGIFSLASEPNGAACEVHLLQEEEFPDAEGDVPDEPPDLAESVLRPRHPSDRRLPARVMFVSKESGHHGMDALDYRTPSVPEEVSEHPPVIVLGDASQSRGHLARGRSEEHTSELQSLTNLVCRLLLE